MAMVAQEQHISTVLRSRRSKRTMTDVELLWKEYFHDPSQWWDYRKVKTNPRSPDFKHKVTKEPLWVNGWNNPSWVYDRTEIVQVEKTAAHGHDMEKLQDESAIMALLKNCARRKDLRKGSMIHAHILNKGLIEKDIYIGSTLVNLYARCGALKKAQEVFDKLPSRNSVTWTVLIAGYGEHGCAEEALNCFDRMRREDLFADAVTYLCALKACGSIGAVEKGEIIHTEIVRDGLLEKDILLGTALVDMYAKCGMLEKARAVFDDLPEQSLVPLTALIGGYAQHGHGEEALTSFEKIELKGVYPDAHVFVCVLKTCGSLGAVTKGKAIHVKIIEGVLRNNVFLGTALVDMYVKCGTVVTAQNVFDELQVRDVFCWTSLITGYAQLGQDEIACDLFDKMMEEGVDPNSVTFTVVLNACSHSGLLEKGQMYFDTMCEIYGLVPTIEQYTCMVDLFGRAGHLDEAMNMIKEMPTSDSLQVWLALIGACQKWGNVEIGRWAFEHALQVDEKDAAAYVCMRNIYVAAGMQEDADKIEAMRLRLGLQGVTSK